jgi:hypothetical protein
MSEDVCEIVFISWKTVQEGMSLFLTKFYTRKKSPIYWKYNANGNDKFLDFLTYILVESVGGVFQQITSISMGTNCAPLLEDLVSCFNCIVFVSSGLECFVQCISNWYFMFNWCIIFTCAGFNVIPAPANW